MGREFYPLNFLHLYFAVDGSKMLILLVKFRVLKSVFQLMQKVWYGEQSPGSGGKSIFP